MTAVRIYMEGGGDTSNTKGRLRQGMGEFLRELKAKCRDSRRNWNLVLSGGRNDAIEDFAAAHRHARPGELIVLLVDSEGPVSALSPAAHLRAEGGQTAKLLKDAPDDAIHLMVQTMETWIVADPEKLARYYGQGFAVNALPKAADLETVDKGEVADALARAMHRTRGAGKDGYKKIEHASDLLAKIDPAKVRQRCRHCDHLFSVLGGAI